MTTPTQSAVDSAAGTISAAETAIIVAAAGVIDPVKTANATAIAALGSALALYDNVSTPNTSQIMQAKAQLESFANTFDYLASAITGMQPASGGS